MLRRGQPELPDVFRDFLELFRNYLSDFRQLSIPLSVFRGHQLHRLGESLVPLSSLSNGSSEIIFYIGVLA
jgi:hypothetical protein